MSFNSFRSDPDEEAECLSGTRKGVLDQIQQWVNGSSQACIFWLNGMAGTGKSTVARTIARAYHDKKQLGASFFFSRGSGDASKATKFFTTIAVQLASSCQSLEPVIVRAVEENENVGDETLRDQWNRLILKPLSGLDPGNTSTPSSLVLVVDALDECDSHHAVVEILRLFAGATALTAVRLRILVTSRPETPIFRGFRTLPEGVYESLALENVPRNVVDKDIFHVFKKRFKNIALSHGPDYLLPPDWPGDAAISFLVQKTAGLFIYAATVCRFIQSNGLWWSPKELLTAFVPDEQSEELRAQARRLPTTSPTAELDAVYTTVLEQLLVGVKGTKDEEDLLLYYKQVLGPLALLFDPLSSIALADLICFNPDTLHGRLSRLRSVLYVPMNQELPIRLLHPSFRDFLISKDGYLNSKYQAGHATTHQLVAEHCLNRLTDSTTGLKKDIFNLRSPGIEAGEAETELAARDIPLALRYACLYWVQHLCATDIPVRDDDLSHRFLETHFLHWLEVLSIIRMFPSGVKAIIALNSVVGVSIITKSDASKIGLSNRVMWTAFP